MVVVPLPMLVSIANTKEGTAMWKPRRQSIWVTSLFCLSLLELQGTSFGAGVPSSSDEVVSRCEDRTSGRTLKYSQNDPCTSLWSDELQDQDQVQGDTEWWKSFRWGPSEMSESELRLLYRPGERRPLWGY